MSEKRPLYLPIAIEEIEREACTGCKLKDLKSNCRFQPLVIYNKEGAPFPEAETNRLELLVVADTPSFDDNKSTRFWGSPSGASLLRKIKGLGVESFAVIPAVRCYPGGDIDHNVLTKKYKGSPKFTKETPLDRATKAVENCKEYVRTTLRTYNPKFVLAMGPLAAAALDLSGSIPQLRTQPIRPKPGLRSANPDEGIIVTYDRFEAATNDWAFREIQRDFQKIGNAKSCGFANPRGNDKTAIIKVLNTVSKVRKFVDWMLTTEFDPQEVMCIDFETENMDLSTETNRLLNVGITRTCDEDVAYVVPLAHPETPFTPDELVEVYALMKRLFRSEGASFYGWCGHNTQYEVTMVKLFFDEWLGEGGNVKTLDTMVMAYIFDEDRSESINRPYSLETLASEMLDFRWYGQSAMKSKRDRLSSEPISDVNTYVGYDAIVTARLLNELLERMQEEGSASDLLRLATKLYGPAIHYTVDLKLTGQQIDVDVLRMLRAPNSSIVHRLGEIEQEFADAPEVAQALAIINQKAHGGKGMAPVFKTNTNKTFSLTSHEHRVALFWDVLELDGANESVDKKFQERHKGNKLVDLFSEYQQLSKLDSSYLKPLADWLQSPNSRDGRVRPNFNLVNTRTGRLSASEPNTQQQPRSDSTAKKQIKGMFKASEGKILVQLDFSQAEVRWLGILSGDEALAEKYKMADEIEAALLKDPNNEDLKRRKKIDGDLHMSTAIMMYRLDPDLPIKDEKEAKKFRQRAKSVCFGLIYGKAAKSLAKDLGIDEEEADEAVELWLSQFPKAAAWLTSQEEYVVKHGYVKSAFGRWRRLPEAQAANMSVVNRAKRQSRNTPIQSAASDGCIYAACRLRDALRTSSDPVLRQIRLINTVHDSLIAEAPFDETAIRSYCKLAKSIFTDRNLLMKDFGVDIIVPLAVDFDIGLNWGNMTDYDFTEKALKRALHDADALRQQPPGTLLSDLKGKGLLFDEQQKKEEK